MAVSAHHLGYVPVQEAGVASNVNKVNQVLGSPSSYNIHPPYLLLMSVYQLPAHLVVKMEALALLHNSAIVQKTGKDFIVNEVSY